VTAAEAIVDQRGIEALTMRAVAKELGSSPMALLYRRRSRPRSHPRPRLLARLPSRHPLAVLDAGGDDRLHLLRALPAVRQRMTLPMAHLGHWLWVFYVIPVLIVVAGIIKSTLAEKRRERKGKDN
jgi:hypothetical protein